MQSLHWNIINIHCKNNINHIERFLYRKVNNANCLQSLLSKRGKEIGENWLLLNSFTTNPKVWPDYFVPIQLCCDVKNHVCPNIEYLTSPQTSLLCPTTYIITKTNKLFAFEIIKNTSSVHKVQTSTPDSSLWFLTLLERFSVCKCNLFQVPPWY